MTAFIDTDDAGLASTMRALYQQQPAEERIAIRRDIARLPGQIVRLAAIILLLLTGVATTRNTTLGLLCLVLLIAASYELRRCCRAARLFALAAIPPAGPLAPRVRDNGPSPVPAVPGQMPVPRSVPGQAVSLSHDQDRRAAELLGWRMADGW